ncbi:hypothetical protein VP01_2777g1 [Puccinia sorghi]|uniref:Uncharacterized protein n=1 Tax=Puccinia sorghi TaxID=27349 RepID=A0A0L6V3G9_9BASI|nr:hypothetical protein VP01_2777g1 [Puccinia sorghi]
MLQTTGLLKHPIGVIPNLRKQSVSESDYLKVPDLRKALKENGINFDSWFSQPVQFTDWILYNQIRHHIVLKPLPTTYESLKRILTELGIPHCLRSHLATLLKLYNQHLSKERKKQPVKTHQPIEDQDEQDFSKQQCIDSQITSGTLNKNCFTD